MAEWHVTPDYMLNNWTDELFDLMVEKLIERKKREYQPEESKEETPESLRAKVSRMGNMVEVTHGD